MRVESAWALWRLEEPGGLLVPPLVQIFRGYQLPRQGDATKELFYGWDAPVAQAGRLLGEIGPEAKPAIPTLIADLEHKRPIVKLAAIHVLRGPPQLKTYRRPKVCRVNYSRGKVTR